MFFARKRVAASLPPQNIHINVVSNSTFLCGSHLNHTGQHVEKREIHVVNSRVVQPYLFLRHHYLQSLLKRDF